MIRNSNLFLQIKVLLEHSHACQFTSCLGRFHATVAELKYLLSGPLQRVCQLVFQRKEEEEKKRHGYPLLAFPMQADIFQISP